MNKVAIIGLHNLHLMQFLYKYTTIFDRNDIDYDVIYWDRDVDNTIKVRPFSGRAIPFRYKMSNYQPKHKKLIGFMKCIMFVREQLKKNNYNRIILLTTQTAFPLFLICPIIRKTRYIYDYRDVTYENNYICKKIIEKIIDYSVYTAISSRGFVDVLGYRNKYIMAHNVSRKLENLYKAHIADEKIRVTFWGMVRQIEYNKKICDSFGKDSRFSVVYHGEGYYEQLQEYCKEKGYHNISFTGRYTADELDDFAANTDILINMYQNDRHQIAALTVKLYDALQYGLPMLITNDSYMSEFIGEQDTVYKTQADELDTEKIYQWYQTLDVSKNPYQKLLSEIQKDEYVFEDRLLSFLK